MYKTVQEYKNENNWPYGWLSAVGLIPYIQKLGPDIQGLEIGVNFGDNVFYFLEQCANIKNIIGIDPYIEYFDINKVVTQDVMDDVKLTMEVNLKDFTDQGRFTLLHGKSTDLADQIADESLDYIFIDGDHSYQAVVDDMEKYFSKVKKGGIFAGHDIWVPGVQRAVEDFRRKNCITAHLETVPNTTWFWIK